MNLELTNLNAVVCGSTQGIGLATAEVLAKLGANIYLLARNETKLKQISQRLDNTKGQVHNYLCIDFQNSGRLEQEIKKIKSPTKKSKEPSYIQSVYKVLFTLF